jgi:peptide/nickel transport system substrate-binding protein
MAHQRMAHQMTRRAFAAVSAAGVASVGFRRDARSADDKTLRFIPRTDLQVLDPIWTTAYASRNHGYMIFDTLFALDSKFRPQPQMVGDYSISLDKLTYRFGLRPGLKFHDGEKVRGVDCTASLQRWMARDTLGQALAASIDEMAGADDQSFTIRLKEPFPLLLDSLAKVSSMVPFIMPGRMAKTDPFKQITDTIGSGPFKFVREEFDPGHKAVYVKNEDYVPRNETPDWASGGKVVRVDRVEWIVLTEPTTAAGALGSGEVDWWENPPSELTPLLAANPDIQVGDADPLGSMVFLRFNQTQPPFDNIKMRQAVLAVTDQEEFLSALAATPNDWKRCPSFFTCGTPMANDVGAAALTGKRDFAGAKRLIAEAGYNGETIKCSDFLKAGNDNIAIIITWLDGYYKDPNAPPVIDFDKFAANSKKLGDSVGKTLTWG